jgi:hypothetical protein
MLFAIGTPSIPAIPESINTINITNMIEERIDQITEKIKSIVSTSL